MNWPKPTELDHFFGAHQLGSDGMPTERWEKSFITSFNAPYPLHPIWAPSLTVRKIRCHRSVLQSLSKILESILLHYGSIEAVQEARMDRFGGGYMFSLARGGKDLSTQSWGAGIALDPENNVLGKPWTEDSGMMPKAVIDIFKAEGWAWGGDFKRPHCAYFEAVNRT